VRQISPRREDRRARWTTQAPLHGDGDWSSNPSGIAEGDLLVAAWPWLGRSASACGGVRMTDRSKVEIHGVRELSEQEVLVLLAMAAAPKVSEPPKLAEFLLILCSGSGKRAEAIQGDLCEQFTHDCAKMSVARARRRYWSRMLASLGPQIGRTIARAVRWAAILSLVKKLFMAG